MSPYLNHEISHETVLKKLSKSTNNKNVLLVGSLFLCIFFSDKQTMKEAIWTYSKS